jgi:hypothetical protein
MPFHRKSGSRRQYQAMPVAASIVAALALLIGATAGAAAPARSASSAPCQATAKGAPWSYKGKTGSTYTLLGVNGASCSLGAAWLKRITVSHGSKSPGGWKCLAISAGIGECQVKGGGIFEYSPKVKK